MKITPENKTLATVFQIGSDNIYSIPIYQRNYSWKEDQIETLFNDIKEEDQGYYVGNLLVNTENNGINVIDGQQRLTTLALFLLAIFEKLSVLDNENKLNPDRKSLEVIMDIKRQLSIPEKGGTPRLKLLDKDQEIWSDLVYSILDNKDPGRWGKYSFYKRYKFIQEKLLTDLESEKEIREYYKKLINIDLLQISVNDLSDAYQVFTSLNSKGLPLTPLDLLKNVFLSNQGDVRSWQELKNIFSPNEEVDDGKMTQFVLNNYDAFENMTTTSSITKGNLVKAYTKIFKSKDYIETLIENAKIFQMISSPDHARYDYSLSGLSQLDSTTAYPLLLFIYKEQDLLKLSEKNINTIIRNLINFYVRRNIALIPKASNARQKLFEIKNYIHKENLKGDDIVDLITNSLNELAPDDNFIRSSLEDGIYDKNKKTTRFILINLERENGTYFHKGNRDTLDKFDEDSNKRIWEIEHILPQSLTNDWKKMLSPDDMSQADSIRDEVVHLVGNLTLTPYNPGLGNQSFNNKLNYKDGINLVGLNLGTHLNNSINKNISNWDKDAILQRNKILTEEIIDKFKIK